jgi:enoyl-CoA hydratase/carnithine racemase
MSAHAFLLSELGEGVASLQIASDEAPHLRLEDLDRLRQAVDTIQQEKSVRALLIEGGARQFCAGANKETLLRPDAAEAIANLVGEVARLILAIPVPTVAAMVGHAVGGGLMLGLWCDAAILAEEALYSANFVSLGFTPGMGSTTLLPQIFGAPLARELLFTGRTLTGAELKRLAPFFAYAVVPRAQARARALALAEEMAQAPPAPVRLFKAHLAAERRAALEAALAHEQRMHRKVFADPGTRTSIAKNYVE